MLPSLTTGELWACAGLIAGVLALVFQAGIAVGQQRRELRVERDRGINAKVLIEWVSDAWRNR